jgi:hypothetical protein
MRIVRFLNHIHRYNAGERAGLGDEQAAEYVAAGHARYDDEPEAKAVTRSTDKMVRGSKTKSAEPPSEG